jgi:hypothetical protein
MASVRVRFRPGFSLGGGYLAEQFVPVWWQETAGGPLRSAISPERGIFRRANGLIFTPAEFKNIQSTSENRFFCSNSILFTQSTMWV